SPSIRCSSCWLFRTFAGRYRITQPDALVAERTHGGEGAAEPDRQTAAQLREDHGGARGEPDVEAEQERAGDVDRQRAGRERPAAGLEGALDEIACQGAEDAAERDVGDHT